MQKVVGVRFKPAGKIYYFDPKNIYLKLQDNVIVETARGLEYGTVAGKVKYVEDEEVTKPIKPVIRKALVELDGAPFKYFQAHRDIWAVETAFTYPGAIQYYGPTEVCDLTTRTLALEKGKMTMQD